MDPALIAAGGIAVFAAGWLGAVAHHTLVSPKREGSPNVGKDTTSNLIDQLAWWQDVCHTLVECNKATEAENRDLHIDIEAKRKRLADAGLQSAGGEA